MPIESRRHLLWVAGPLLALLLIYGPDVGRGFLKDDFRWIRDGRAGTSILAQDNGFYRPVVAATFAANERLFGPRPQAYGLTNLVLLLVDAVLVGTVAMAVGMEAGAALLAGALWALNPHGINMAVLWISGRTSLLLVLFALLAALAFVRGHRLWAAVSVFLALLSKEEAVLLPLILAVWSARGATRTEGRWSARRATKAWPVFVPLVPYFLLRSRTAAYLPLTAPSYYRFTFSPVSLGRNVLEYADRAGTLTVAAILLLALVVWRRPRLDEGGRRCVALGLAWLLGGYGLTIFLPVRSSLYACFPAVGAAWIGAAVGAALWRDAAPRKRPWLLAAAALLPLALTPVYRSRNVRWVRPAEASSRILASLAPILAALTPGTTVVLEDNPADRGGMASVFGTLIGDAAALISGRRDVRIWVEPPPPDWQGTGMTPPGQNDPVVRLRYQQGRLVTVP